MKITIHEVIHCYWSRLHNRFVSSETAGMPVPGDVKIRSKSGPGATGVVKTLTNFLNNDREAARVALLEGKTVRFITQILRERTFYTG